MLERKGHEQNQSQRDLICLNLPEHEMRVSETWMALFFQMKWNGGPFTGKFNPFFSKSHRRQIVNMSNWVSWARVMFRRFRQASASQLARRHLLARFCQLLDCSIDRSISRVPSRLVRSRDPSLEGSFDRLLRPSIARSIGSIVARLIGHSIARSMAQSLPCSITC